METLFLYIAKSSGLIGMFYIAYYFLLRKETFFTANRWFLLAGLFTSVILPCIVFTTIVWVEPTTNDFNWSKIPVTPIQKESFEINWYFVLIGAYSIGITLLLIQFAFDFYNLNRVLKGKKVSQQADHKFIDLKENIAPFSYFNTIVYNSSLYNESEMESILEHEKVHSEQYHTIDVLITRFFCILFWFNPFIWLYKKAILQNLEFIADSEAAKNISDKKVYQLTLLKITTHENCVAITNHFYQSLIKKRIVMLNKNQSKKRNSWKYALVIPALVGFVFLFQIQVIAKEKPQNPITQKIVSVSKPEDVDVYKITKNTTDAELQEKAVTILKIYGVNVLFSHTKRNTNNEITEITVEFKKGKEIAKNKTIKSTDSIKPFGIVITKNSTGNLNIDLVEEHEKYSALVINTNIIKPDAPISGDANIYIDGSKSDKAEMDKLDPKEIASVDVIKNKEKQEIRIITKNHSKILNENKIYINGKKATQNELDQLDQGSIERMDVNNFDKSIRVVTKNGTYPNNANMPIPPAPPIPPVFKNPKAPVFPKAPKAPQRDPINGDKKAWKDYEKKMEEYDAKMKKIEPQMKAFDKKMAEFDKQMEPFNKEMVVFDKKMKEYDKQMTEYNSKMVNLK